MLFTVYTAQTFLYKVEKLYFLIYKNESYSVTFEIKINFEI